MATAARRDPQNADSTALHRFESVSLATVDVRGIRNRFSVAAKSNIRPETVAEEPASNSSVSRSGTEEKKPVMRRWAAHRSATEVQQRLGPVTPEQFIMYQKETQERERLQREAAERSAHTFRFKPLSILGRNPQQSETTALQTQPIAESPVERQMSKPQVSDTDKGFGMLRGIVARNRALFNGGFGKSKDKDQATSTRDSGSSSGSGKSSRLSFRRSSRDKKSDHSKSESVVDRNERLYRESMKLADTSSRRLNPFRGSVKQVDSSSDSIPRSASSDNPYFEGIGELTTTKKAFSMFRRKTTGSTSSRLRLSTSSSIGNSSRSLAYSEDDDGYTSAKESDNELEASDNEEVTVDENTLAHSDSESVSESDASSQGDDDLSGSSSQGDDELSDASSPSDAENSYVSRSRSDMSDAVESDAFDSETQVLFEQDVPEHVRSMRTSTFAVSSDEESESASVTARFNALSFHSDADESAVTSFSTSDALKVRQSITSTENAHSSDSEANALSDSESNAMSDSETSLPEDNQSKFERSNMTNDWHATADTSERNGKELSTMNSPSDSYNGLEHYGISFSSGSEDDSENELEMFGGSETSESEQDSIRFDTGVTSESEPEAYVENNLQSNVTEHRKQMPVYEDRHQSMNNEQTSPIRPEQMNNPSPVRSQEEVSERSTTRPIDRYIGAVSRSSTSSSSSSVSLPQDHGQGTLVQQRMRMLEAQSEIERFGSAVDPDVASEMDNLREAKAAEEATYRQEQERLQQLLLHQQELSQSQQSELSEQELQDLEDERMYQEQVKHYMQQLAMQQGDMNYDAYADQNELMPSFYEQYLIEDEEGEEEPILTWMSRPLSIVMEDEAEEEPAHHEQGEDFVASLLAGEAVVNPFVEEYESDTDNDTPSSYASWDAPSESHRMEESNFEYESDGLTDDDDIAASDSDSPSFAAFSNYDSDVQPESLDFSKSSVAELKYSQSMDGDDQSLPSTPESSTSLRSNASSNGVTGGSPSSVENNKFTAFLRTTSEQSDSSGSTGTVESTSSSSSNKLMDFIHASRNSGAYDDM